MPAAPTPEEKVYAAEHQLMAVRAAIIAFNIAAYYLLLPAGTGVPWLAAAVSLVAGSYAVFGLAVRPYRRFPVLLSSYATSATDAALISLWLGPRGAPPRPSSCCGT